jgi:hypothetical protein
MTSQDAWLRVDTLTKPLAGQLPQTRSTRDRLIERSGCRENPLRHADQAVGEIQGLSSGLTTVMSSSLSISFRREIMSPSSVVNVSRSGTVSLMVFA